MLNVASSLTRFQHCNRACAAEPVLVPPTWNKAQYQEVASIWQRAADRLSEAENIVVVGFSLPPTDEFFKFLFALGAVGPARIERFWVIDPSGEVASRFKALLGGTVRGRFEHIQGTFDAGIRVTAERLGLGNIDREVR